MRRERHIAEFCWIRVDERRAFNDSCFRVTFLRAIGIERRDGRDYFSKSGGHLCKPVTLEAEKPRGFINLGRPTDPRSEIVTTRRAI